MVLNLLRKKKTMKRIMWVIAILIVPAFIFWGSGSATRNKGNIRFAGTIFGRKVPRRDYARSLDASYNQARLIYGDSFSRIEEYLNLNERAWSRLILLYQAKRKKVMVTDSDVIDWVKDSPLFQKEGKFDRERYKLILHHLLRTDPRKFEEELRDSLKIARLRETVLKDIGLSESEAKEAYRQENEKAEVSYILIESESFKENVTVTEKELKNYYNTHREEFRQPARINTEYLNLIFDKFKDGASIDDEDIQDYYDSHLKEFIQPSEKTEEESKEPEYKPLPEVRDKIKSNLILQETKRLADIKASQIIEELADEPDLEKIARNNELAVKETGFFAAQELIPNVGFSYQFTKTAFDLKKGEISGVTAGPQGLYFIRLKEKKDSYISSFEEAKTKIEAAMQRVKMKEMARQKAEEIQAKIKEKGFEGTAKKLSLAVKKTEPFTRKGYIPDVGEAPEFSSAAFKLKAEEISPAVSVPNGYAILRLDILKGIDEEKWLEEKEKFKETLLAQKQERHFQDWFLKLREEANLKSNIPQTP